MFLDLEDYKDRYFNFYKNSYPNKNLFQAYFHPLWGGKIFLEKYKYNLIARQRFTSDTISKFMAIHPQILLSLSLSELMVLKNIYSDLNIDLGFLGDLKQAYIRSSERIQTYMKIQIEFKNLVELSNCYDVSKEGICFRSQQKFNNGDQLKIKVFFNSSEFAYIDVKIVWVKSSVYDGSIIIQSTEWDQLYYSLSTDYHAFNSISFLDEKMLG